MEHARGSRTSFICLIALSVVAGQTAGDWTDWYSRPIDIETNNDIETADAIKTVHPALMCDNPTSIEATTLSGITAQQTGDVLRQFNASGLVCMDEDQDNRTCHDYKVRFCCPGSHGTMTCGTDEMLSRYPIEAFAEVNVTEDIYLGVPIFNASDFLKDGYFKHFSFVEIVSGNKYNRFGVSEDNRQIIVAAFLSASITPTFNLTIHMKRKNGTREAYGLHIQVVDVDHWPPFYNKTCESPERPIIQYWPWFFDYKVNDDWVSQLTVTPPEHKWSSIYVNIDIDNSECCFTLGGPLELKSYNHFNFTEVALVIMNQVTQDVEEVWINGPESEHFQIRSYEWNHPKVENLITRILSSGREPASFNEYAAKHMYVEVTAKGVFSSVEHIFKISLKERATGQTILPPYVTYHAVIIGCPHGTFGARCDRECMCKNGATCHAWDGACKCAPGWQGPACDIPEAAQISMSVRSTTVRIHGNIYFECDFTNVKIRHAVFEHDGRILTTASNGRMIKKYYDRVTVHLAILNTTHADSGMYRCLANGYNGNLYFQSNYVLIDVKGCEDNVWGRHCNKKCDCVHSDMCTQSGGCQCERGWTGAKCDRDILQPFIHNCPTNITKLVHGAANTANVTWLPIRASDNDGIKSIQATHRSGEFFPVGTTEVTISVFDHWNNRNECTFTVTVKGISSNSIVTVIGSVAFCFTLIMVAATMSWWGIKRRKSRHRIHRYFRIDDDLWQKNLPLDVKKINKSDLQMCEILGEGTFAKVYKALMTLVNGGGTMMVAVKQIKDEAEYWHQFIHEVQLLRRLKGHPNVIQLIAVIHDQGLCGIVIELMSMDLLSYLKDCKNVGKNKPNRRLLAFASQIAKAIEHLHNQQVVHRDIAARNMLISSDNVKIADFGLSRDVYQKGQYQRHPTRGMFVPIRWIAPESLATGVYTYKSDIWAYGVLLWEMATLGDIPYPEFQPLDPDFLSRKLCEGYRMPKPARCTDDIYGMMRHCWRNSPDERPTATGLVNNISGLEICNKGFFKMGGF
ncbi:uncharacterized protein [Ptychodera flava]|uniref:uncharacterized protein isoform X2 n=1 Tax=Ptychodera flava TaxID=63121 RepID=UPI00396A1F58